MLELLKRNVKLNQADYDIWSMTRAQRNAQIDEWRDEGLGEVCQELTDLSRKLERDQAIRRELKNDTKIAALQSRRIIGCTTTGAAIHRDLLAHVKIGVLIVEEAGEILESHVLSALSRSVKSVIMIGDHQQLRPKISDYKLQVESGKGYDLNRSLFERLVLSNFPYATLLAQHRMHPAISKLIRGTYPQLQDAMASVNDQKREFPRGLQQRVTFIDTAGQHPENSHASMRQLNDGEATSSKVNLHEVEMIIRTLRYVLQQGYQESDVVILVPYLGQLAAIKEAIKRYPDLRAEVSDLDEQDLRAAQDKQKLQEMKMKQQKGAASAPPAAAASSSSSSSPAVDPPAQALLTNGRMTNGIRLATIDNYQGEEANIVLASLVRSNREGVVGFIGEPERVNVLMSRARCGFIMIGDSHTLEGAKNPKARALWSKYMETMRQNKYASTGLPIVCQRHPNERRVLTNPSDFGEFTPQGGCRLPCGVALPCGHVCELKCHPDQSIHAKPCRRGMTRQCPAGHDIKLPCCESNTASELTCKRCDQIKKAEEAAAAKRAADEKAREEAKAAALLKQQKMHAQLKDLRAQLADAQSTREREVEQASLESEVALLHGQLAIHAQSGAAVVDAEKAVLKQELDQNLEKVRLNAQRNIERLQSQISAQERQIFQSEHPGASMSDGPAPAARATVFRAPPTAGGVKFGAAQPPAVATQPPAASAAVAALASARPAKTFPAASSPPVKQEASAASSSSSSSSSSGPPSVQRRRFLLPICRRRLPHLPPSPPTV